MHSSRHAIERHCREVIRSCMNIVDSKGDTYVAIHKDDDMQCVVLVTMFHTYPIMSVIVADKILFSQEHESDMFKAANELNSESVTGWHTLVTSEEGDTIYMYRRCLWMTAHLEDEEFIELLCTSIAEYRKGRRHLTPQPTDAQPTAPGTDTEETRNRT